MSDWDDYRFWLCHEPATDIFLDLSRMQIPRAALVDHVDDFESAFEAMNQLEQGAIANPDEQRMVGHYWLRAPELAPRSALSETILNAQQAIETFATRIHQGEVLTPAGRPFSDFLCIGIGGSALGPQLVADALGGDDRLRPSFLDNTDPNGIARVLASIGKRLPRTLVLVISKSGGTAETRNGMLEVIAALAEQGLDPNGHLVAITGEGSALDRKAKEEGWLARFPMWDWVGGRTSQTSAVGLLPAALQGIEVKRVLAGAAAMDRATRRPTIEGNPAALLALAWYRAGNGRGDKAMVVLPYRDRLVLLSRYLQQLVMESLGKSHDLDGESVQQGITVYGNKGSTDQHAYVQQLRDGRHDFFATLIEVLTTDGESPLEVEPGVTSGDYLSGFLHGTRQALSDAGRASLTITLPCADAFRLGAVIALFERAVGLYASLINVNAYHQPGVEAGKQAANDRLALQRRLLESLSAEPQLVTQLANRLDTSPEAIYQLGRHLAANRSDIDVEGDWHSPEVVALRLVR